jgi:hypothetical protein
MLFTGQAYMIRLAMNAPFSKWVVQKSRHFWSARHIRAVSEEQEINIPVVELHTELHFR